jgi:hypothetical protein
LMPEVEPAGAQAVGHDCLEGSLEGLAPVGGFRRSRMARASEEYVCEE